ncbi:MAG: hypothetical protein KQH63_16765 [Desulfobulbaceae bacterium]|nr:hypothetical protein [Desulfobulbaceae bacterium]
MDQTSPFYNETSALVKAAKYVCNLKCGLCPMVVEDFFCEFDCNLETRPWQCWLHYFKERATLRAEG